MTQVETHSDLGSRIHWMDNLRSVVIFLVVLYHIGGVYEAAGLWDSVDEDRTACLPEVPRVDHPDLCR